MPKGGKGKPAGGYHAGAKNTGGCKNGYPTISADGTVHGCHPTKAAAAAQARAIWASVNSKKFETQDFEKATVSVGNFVVFMGEEDEVMVGRVELMVVSGMLGLEGSEYAIEGTTEDPALAVRCYEQEDGVWEEECHVMYVKSSEVVKIESLPVEVETVVDMPSDAPATVNAFTLFDSLSREEKTVEVTKSDSVPVQEEPKVEETQESFFNFRDMKPVRNNVRLGE